MDPKDLLKYGIEYEDGLKRCLNDDEFYKSILECFIQSDSMKRANEAYTNKDFKSLYASLHEMKGSSGNASLTNLYNCICPLLKILRENPDNDFLIKDYFLRVKDAYNLAQEGIFEILNR